MNRYQALLTVSALGLSLAGSYVWAAETTPPTTDRPMGNQPIVRPGRPPEFARPNMPEDVKKMIAEFRAARETFTAEQKQLRQGWKDLTVEQRKALRDTLRDNRENFIADQKAAREQIRERLVELRNEFKNNRDKVTDAAQDAKEKARQFKERNRGNMP